MDGTGGEEKAAPRWIDEPRNIALIMVAQAAIGFGIGLAIWWGTGRAVSAFLRWEAADLLVAALTGGALIAAMQAILLLFPRFLPWAAERQLMLFEHGRRYRPAHILLISLGAGIGEEALFRGGLQTFLGDHLPAPAAILLASLAFALLHVASRGILAFVFGIGVMLGAVYHFTDSLTGVMLAHAALDVWALAIIQRELARQGLVKD